MLVRSNSAISSLFKRISIFFTKIFTEMVPLFRDGDSHLSADRNMSTMLWPFARYPMEMEMTCSATRWLVPSE